MDRFIAIGFTGGYEDLVAFAYPLGNGYRWYLPALMRFSAADSYSPFSAGGIHPYSYCAADPINHIDPTGHMHVSTYGLTIEQTLDTLAQMDARDAAGKTGRRPVAATHESPPEPRVGPNGAATAGGSRGGDASGAGAIGAHQAAGAAMPYAAGPARRMHAQTGRARAMNASVLRMPTFTEVLAAAKPEFGGARRIVRARAVGIVRALQERFPGEVRSITTLPGYRESAFIRYLGTPEYESLRSMIRRYSSAASGAVARAEWRSIAPYLGVDVSDVL
jgi:RHS repeat-associated protein